VVLTNGMAMSGITSSIAVSVKSSDQTATQESGSKSTKVSTTQETAMSSYFDQLQGPIKKTTVNLNIVGTYTAFKNLLTQLENQTRIITIKSVAVSPAGQEVSKSGTKNNLTFNIVLDVYSY
jgi:Tfp pilus assembly protein PilO